MLASASPPSHCVYIHLAQSDRAHRRALKQDLTFQDYLAAVLPRTMETVIVDDRNSIDLNL